VSQHSRPVPGQTELPIQPVENPILCNAYEEPTAHWVYDADTGEAFRREAPGVGAALSPLRVGGACAELRRGGATVGDTRNATYIVVILSHTRFCYNRIAPKETLSSNERLAKPGGCALSQPSSRYECTAWFKPGGRFLFLASSTGEKMETGHGLKIRQATIV
jgi:hypothetical protein